MPTTTRRHTSRPHGAEGLGPSGPVVLGTLSARIAPKAEELAIASALEAGVELIVANAVHLPPYPSALSLGGPGVATLPHEEDLDAVRATAERAATFGLRVQHLRVTTPRPARALVQIAHEAGAGLLVLGPDPARVGRWRLRRAAREVRHRAGCLVWVPPGT